jgi:hypothetical protein
MTGRVRCLLLAAACLVALTACAGFEPMDPPSNTDIKPGPGLFSGKTGEFVIPSPR